MAKEMLTLNNGVKMQAFALGTWLSKKGEVGAAVEAALKGGYRRIDCAHIYGNEVEIGEALQKCFKEGVVKREEIFVTSKLWNTEHGRDDVLPACQNTLKDLQLDYLDLYLMHWPIDVKKGYKELRNLTPEERLGYDQGRVAACWEGMEELVSKGLVKAIGISNFTITKTDHLLQTAKIVPAVNQVECNPYFQQQKLKEYLASKDILLEAYSPLGNPTRPARTDADPVVLDDPVIKEIATKLNSTPAQVCIAFALHRGLAVAAKSVTPSRIEENLKATQLKLDVDDMRRLREIDINFRSLHGKIFWQPTDTLESFWDTKEDEKFVVTEPEAKKQKTGEE